MVRGRRHGRFREDDVFRFPQGAADGGGPQGAGDHPSQFGDLLWEDLCQIPVQEGQGCRHDLHTVLHPGRAPFSQIQEEAWQGVRRRHIRQVQPSRRLHARIPLQAHLQDNRIRASYPRCQDLRGHRPEDRTGAYLREGGGAGDVRDGGEP